MRVQPQLDPANDNDTCFHCNAPFPKGQCSTWRRSERHVLAAFRCSTCDAPLDAANDNAKGWRSYYCPISGRNRVELSHGTEPPPFLAVTPCGLCKGYYLNDDGS